MPLDAGGATVGASVVGVPVVPTGADDGAVVGAMVGLNVGDVVGLRVVGASVTGIAVGAGVGMVVLIHLTVAPLLVTAFSPSTTTIRLVLPRVQIKDPLAASLHWALLPATLYTAPSEDVASAASPQRVSWFAQLSPLECPCVQATAPETESTAPTECQALEYTFENVGCNAGRLYVCWLSLGDIKAEKTGPVDKLAALNFISPKASST